MGAEAAGRLRPGRYDDRPTGLGLVAAALDDQLLVADPYPRPVAELRGTVQPASIEPGAVARAGVLEDDVAGHRDASLPARDTRVVQLERAAGRPANGRLADQGHPRAVGEDELESLGGLYPAAAARGRHDPDIQPSARGVLNSARLSRDRPSLLSLADS